MNNVITVIAAAGLLAAAGCEKKTTPPPNPAPKTTTTTPSTTTPALPTAPTVDTSSLGALAGEAKDKAVAAFESGMASAKTKLDEWTTKASAAAEDKKPEMNAALDKLKSSYNTLSTDLSQLKGKAGAEWDKAWSNLKSSWSSFETSMNDFTAKYKP